MKKGERYIVISNEGARHPVGTEVIVLHQNQSDRDSKPLYCRAREGQTAYWYAEDELAKEIDGIRV